MDETVAELYRKIEADAAQARLQLHCYAHEYVLLGEFLTAWQRPTGIDGTYRHFGAGGAEVLNGMAVQVHLSTHESFTVVEPLVSWLLGREWEACGQYEEAWDSVYTIGYRELKFKKKAPTPLYFTESQTGPTPPTTLYCTVRMWPHKDSQVCKRVEVGTQPAYKLVCEGQS